VSLPKNPYVLKSLHFESLHGEKLDARDRQIGPSGQVPMVPGGLKVHFRMDDGRKPGAVTYSVPSTERLLNAKHFSRLPPKSVARQEALWQDTLREGSVRALCQGREYQQRAYLPLKRSSPRPQFYRLASSGVDDRDCASSAEVAKG